ncbi:4-galactosyl-N-acetylglucosaminide 3-alpha-L-fucosyltransferase 9-like [Carcharodon carcharias]|uniref:4-galactosyl-N-acetylglucosaminide 3-alpha-L-fucosyltransferase 9-like n=1 Tax=Carcharodon carcharias TaxID=13397 RepID=UPI001B7EB896|nr:4-galactosyl-N-acetylglucosaminide 3-alpha-L-fucosyltransferase 9-like [Carcharodon carcharias]XP_041043158.1 4-galactosyl-N-acetylglucosaminide 3-alpha-L-fucosyltransferase 9-like [Carcharodon carcharias]
MIPAPSIRIFHILFISFTILGCFLAILLLYVKPSNIWVYPPLESATSALGVKKPFVTGAKEDETIVLLWLWPFGQKFELSSCESTVNIHDCHLTADRNLYNKSHAVLFHHQDISGDLSNLPKQPRPTFQKWIWMNLESPTLASKKPGLDQLFNLTLTYRWGSDIEVPYGSLIMNKVPLAFELPSKSSLVCWVVSHWNINHARVKYYNEFRKYINISTYGRAFGKRLEDNQFIPTIAACKFYLAFENSIHKDYITEKLYNPLRVGTVPVVLGPSRKNYENYIPADSFIHVDDFHSAKELVDYLHKLDGNKDLYMQYFKWRKYYTVRMPHFWVEHLCKACENIKQHRKYRSCSSLEKWFWG